MNVPKVVGELIILAVLVGWTAFWAAIAWLNYSLGDTLGAALTLVLFALGTAAALLWRLRSAPTRMTGA